MGLAELTDRGAVESAMAEFDRIGRSAFLEKYGFGEARSYFLAHDGKLYDSKAIVGAAHGHQFPRLGPLQNTDFSGGEATVAATLQRLGFRVERHDGQAAPDRDGPARRSPDWSRDELILALDLYMVHGGRTRRFQRLTAPELRPKIASTRPT
jgi:hypothetical protein